jgi:type VI secretion system protein VasI
MCQYYGPIDKATGTGLYVTWILKALDKKTGKRSLITPGSGTPPQAVSWEAVKTQYEVVQEVPWGDSVTIRIPSEASTHIPSMPQFGTETHHIECAGMSDERHYLLVDTQRYVDGKNTACSEGNPDWRDDSSHVLATLNQDPKGNPGKWKTTTSVSSFDDSKTVALSLLADNQISGWPGIRTTPALILRCKEGKTEAYIAAGLQAKLEFVDGKSLDSASMRGRYDQDETIHFLMPKSTDGKSFFFLWPTGEIARMWSHSSLVLEFTPFNSNPVEIRFDLTGLNAAVPPLRHACGWRFDFQLD